MLDTATESEITILGKAYKATQDDEFAERQDARRHAYVLQLGGQLTHVKYSYRTGKYTVYHRPKR